ncbi:hypothetical protein Slala03_51690 [Streptomyces lavendulae subsp. lavendulae]|nr:hypothetical protein Slala03_51690 [Streptomyces lavendulae subsp. lavendulae]
MTLVCGGALNPYLHARGRRSVAGRPAALGVTVVDGPGSKVRRGGTRQEPVRAARPAAEAPAGAGESAAEPVYR